MKIEYVVICFLIVFIISIMLYLIGERTWGKAMPNRWRRLAFWFYRKINRLKIYRSRHFKVAVLLHLMKVQNEITSVSVQFDTTKRIFDSKTKYKLIDIYDDHIGHRYLKIKTRRGTLIFEIMEYIRTSINQKIKDEVLSNKPEGDNKEYNELHSQPVLKVIK